jgi:hypothetical protein
LAVVAVAAVAAMMVAAVAVAGMMVVTVGIRLPLRRSPEEYP